ncbi:uncharacterized protein SPAPADRAFT_61359 [Spathaspora passalidarum NRRL Y-27907]|uniref:Uncharacterized protein n=1 Tax=Spathaspora passalidarum (strain NRRL Y-27907 / 11-Y1) TaxID=619300 RepID=G3APV2_SPAPN|nr:uncharacterized protein SPAPADRAFT_61359 [Spathaspora passalidarum NRRL Y-27907]EGW32273.1 hypothetical protein SPAPADRAFT_61359 [Spathaspora passalidarum NRRL Y-27907]
MLVTFKYNRDKYNQLLEQSVSNTSPYVKEETPSVSGSTPPVSTPTKFVTLHYNSGYMTSPIKSQRRSRNRTPTPPSLTPNTTLPFQKSFSVIDSSPIKISKEDTADMQEQCSYQDAIESMATYNEQYILNPRNNDDIPSVIAHNQQVEKAWFNNIRSLADRLHLLRETYRTVQMLKKSKVNRNGLVDESAYSKSTTPRIEDSPSVSVPPTTPSSRLVPETTSGVDEDEYEEIDGFEEDEDSSNTDTVTPKRSEQLV